jgi:hypothetical protein
MAILKNKLAFSIILALLVACYDAIAGIGPTSYLTILSVCCLVFGLLYVLNDRRT